MKNGDYILVIAPDWYRGKRYRNRYCYEHHLVWEKEHGQPVPDGFIVHHKDHNKFNNLPENLELMSVEAHGRLHKKPKAMALLKCPNCGKNFTKEKRSLSFRKMCFCSRHCVGKYFGQKLLTNEKKEADKNNNVISYFLE